jgi:PAS domain S-box-containing protein
MELMNNVVSEKDDVFAKFFEISPDLLCILDKHGKILKLNKQWELVLGFTMEEIYLMNFSDLLHPLDRETIDEIIKDENVVIYTKKFLRKDGNYRWFEYKMVPNIDVIFVSARDITHMKIIESELLKAKENAESANNLKSQFLANMSHEIRTPLNGIMGFLDLIYQTELNSEQKELIKDVRVSSEILLYLINDILDFSKIEAGKLSLEDYDFSLRSLIEDAASMFIPKCLEKNIKINTLINANVPDWVRGDPLRLRQVINNLMSNAVKFTDKGSIKLQVDVIKKAKDYNLIKFVVSDTGIGIKSDDIKKLFKPFSQVEAITMRKCNGTGLGLAISKEIVNIMGGEISVNSTFGKGTAFTFTAKIKVETNEVDLKPKLINRTLCSEEVRLKLKSICGQKKISLLVVEDNEIDIKLLTKVISNWGFLYDVAKNGYEAVEAFKKTRYDIILMDCKLPVMDGYTCVQEIREIEGDSRHTWIIAITAHALTGDRKKCLESGMDDYITKPLNFELVFKKILDAIERL